MSEQDFVQKNGAFLLTVISLMGTFCAGLTVYMLKSRCTKIQCCCSSCERDVLPVEVAMQDV